MADTTNYAWHKPTVSGDLGAWGTILNTLFDDIDTDLKATDDAVAATVAVANAALAKAGGTMTGVLVNTNATDATTSTTGSVKLTGGLGVAKAICAGTGFGCNSKGPQTAATAASALSYAGVGSYGFISSAQLQATIVLINQIRAALVANGVMV